MSTLLQKKLSAFLGEKEMDWDKELKHAEDNLSKYKIASYKEKDEEKLSILNKAISHWKSVIKELKKAIKDEKQSEKKKV